MQPINEDDGSNADFRRLFGDTLDVRELVKQGAGCGGDHHCIQMLGQPGILHEDLLLKAHPVRPSFRLYQVLMLICSR